MNLSIENAIIDRQLQTLLTSMQITHLNLIQWEALEKGLFYHSSLLVCTPSGSGKTLIGIMGIGHILLNNLGKCIYLVPYKALAAEKAKLFKQILNPFHFRVQEITGDSDEITLVDEQVDLIITTFEKCDALLRANNSFLREVSGIVIDEIHEMGSKHRGARLEFLIVRLLTSLRHVQIIALSATVANIDQVFRWFQSFHLPIELIHSDDRPVPLNYILQVAPHKLTTIKVLTRKYLSDGGQVLIFVNRRKDCISMAKNLVNVVKKTLTEEEMHHCLKGQAQLKNHHTVAQDLQDVIASGVAYHNASLNSFDRHTVERLYLQHHIKVLIATTTLAAGINLPARAVIVYDIIQHRKHYKLEDADYLDPTYVMALGGQGVIKPHSPNLLFQMLGRAGRKGFDPKGEGYILCRDDIERNFARSYYFASFVGPLGEMIPKYALLKSQLNSTPTLQEIVLLTIARYPFISEPQILKVLQKTFYFFCLADRQEVEPLQAQIKEFLFLDRMTLPYFLQAYGHPTAFNIDDSLISYKLTKGSPSHITGTVFYQNAQFHCEIKLTRGFYCSCRPSRRVTFTKSNDNTFATKLCLHQTLFIHYLEGLKETPLPDMLKVLLPRMLKHEYIFESLKRNKLVAQAPRTALYSITSLGLLSTSLYLYPHEIIWVKSVVESFALSSEEVMLDKFVQLYLFQNRKNFQKVLDVITSWIDEYTMQDLLAHHAKLGVGDIFTMTREVARCGEMFHTVARFLGKMDTAQTCLRMSQQIAHGIKAELVPLTEGFPNLSRNQARILYDAGFTSIQDVNSVPPLTIHQLTQISLSRIMKILQPNKIPFSVLPGEGTLDPFFKK